MTQVRQVLHIYIEETLQAFIMISIIHYLKPSIDFDSKLVLKLTFYMGIIFTVLKLYNQDYYDKAQGGIFYSLGSSCVSF